MSGSHGGQSDAGQVEPAPLEQCPLILTLWLHEADQVRFYRLRRLHFPPHLNVIPAHVTLFHSLPDDRRYDLAEMVRARCARRSPFQVDVTGLRSLGRGVAFTLVSNVLTELRATLAAACIAWLTPQDRQGYRPHVTIHNKADPAEARTLLQAVQASFVPFAIRAEGLRLWRYRDGPWDEAGQFAFSG